MGALELVERQLEAYNRHDMEAFVACYAEDVVMVRLPDGASLGRGHADLRSRYASRFAPGSTVHAVVRHRIVLGNKVLDHESVTGLGPEPVEVVAMYEVVDEAIRWIGFVYA